MELNFKNFFVEIFYHFHLSPEGNLPRPGQNSKNFIANAHCFALHLRPKFLIHAIIPSFKKI
jgi:hypothetical protein